MWLNLLRCRLCLFRVWLWCSFQWWDRGAGSHRVDRRGRMRQYMYQIGLPLVYHLPILRMDNASRCNQLSFGFCGNLAASCESFEWLLRNPALLCQFCRHHHHRCLPIQHSWLVSSFRQQPHTLWLRQRLDFQHTGLYFTIVILASFARILENVF